MDREARAGFYSALSHHLESCGFEAHVGGVFTHGDRGRPTDWLSITGNSYFYVVSVGVVFPELSAELSDCVPAQAGMRPLDGIPSDLLPFVFGPGSRYVKLPARATSNPNAELTDEDAGELADVACGPLLQELARFHDLKAAIQEAESTLETGGAKIFLLVLAYLKYGRVDAAREFAQGVLSTIKSESLRKFYDSFLINIERSRNLSLRNRRM